MKTPDILMRLVQVLSALAVRGLGDIPFSIDHYGATTKMELRCYPRDITARQFRKIEEVFGKLSPLSATDNSIHSSIQIEGFIVDVRLGEATSCTRLSQQEVSAMDENALAELKANVELGHVTISTCVPDMKFKEEPKDTEVSL